ncbi:MAG: sensor histidine kinase [Lachnospiraceae bacterium]|nr:sensor histidine kinase [Lachnospiraceae bacterium]
MKKDRKLRALLESISLKKKLAVMVALLLLPFIVVSGFLLHNLNRLYNSYDAIVKNVTRINTYNLAFKEEMDAVVYQMIARSMNKAEIESELGMKNPDRMITDAETDLENMKADSTSQESSERIRSIIKLMITLRKRMNDIDSTVKISGYYEENMVRLDTDIRIITELIQEKISEYIYYETEHMEEVRQEMDAWRRRLMDSTILMVFMVLLLAIFLSLVITRSITRPIQELCIVTERVGKGDFSVRSEPMPGDNEIAILSNRFNSMISQIGALVDNIKQEQINSRNLELKLLQAQINPHFLYNTLDNIVWLSEDNRKDDVAEIVTSLSMFFRTTLSGGRDFIRIEEEISHIDAYLKIQQFRYRDILSYSIEIPGEFFDYLILKMALQPVVENALYHGIKYKRDMGTIRIGIEDKGENLMLVVEDDGIGMKEEQLDRLRDLVSGKIQPEEDNSGFGIANVAERLRLNYGEGYGITFTSVFGEGTRVEILIPKRTEQIKEALDE